MLAACWYVHAAYTDAWAIRDHTFRRSSRLFCAVSPRCSTCPLHVCHVFVSAASQAFACSHCLVNLLPRVARCCYFILPVSMSCAPPCVCLSIPFFRFIIFFSVVSAWALCGSSGATCCRSSEHCGPVYQRPCSICSCLPSSCFRFCLIDLFNRFPLRITIL
jgi:hypothetical protein